MRKTELVRRYYLDHYDTPEKRFATKIQSRFGWIRVARPAC